MTHQEHSGVLRVKWWHQGRPWRSLSTCTDQYLTRALLRQGEETSTRSSLNKSFCLKLNQDWKCFNQVTSVSTVNHGVFRACSGLRPGAMWSAGPAADPGTLRLTGHSVNHRSHCRHVQSNSNQQTIRIFWISSTFHCPWEKLWEFGVTASSDGQTSSFQYTQIEMGNVAQKMMSR